MWEPMRDFVEVHLIFTGKERQEAAGGDEAGQREVLSKG